MRTSVYGISMVSGRQDAFQKNRSVPDLQQIEKRVPDVPVGSGVRFAHSGARRRP